LSRGERCLYLLNTNLPITAYIAWVSGRRGHPSIGWLRSHGQESCYTKITIAELRELERRGKLCPGDANKIISFLESFGVRYRRMAKTFLRSARELARRGDIRWSLVVDAALLLYAKSHGMHVVTYNYRDFQELSSILGWSYTVPPGAPLGPQDYPQLYLCRCDQRVEAGEGRGGDEASRAGGGAGSA